MEVAGTGVAAGVAQTALQAQQVARRLDGQRTEQAEARRREVERMRAAAEMLGATEDADAELPDRQAPGYENLFGDRVPEPAYRPEPHSEAGEAPATAEAGHRGDLNQPPPLYRHLDVRA